MTMIRCALESPDLGQAFKYLERYHITHRKFSRATWSRKVCKKWMKVRNFETLSCLWKVKFCLSRIFWGVASFLYVIISWFDVRWKALIMDKLFNDLNSIISPIKNFLEPLEVEKFVQKLMKVRNFESLTWLWKAKFCLYRMFWSIASLLCIRMPCFGVR